MSGAGTPLFSMIRMVHAMAKRLNNTRASQNVCVAMVMRMMMTTTTTTMMMSTGEEMAKLSGKSNQQSTGVVVHQRYGYLEMYACECVQMYCYYITFYGVRQFVL